MICSLTTSRGETVSSAAAAAMASWKPFSASKGEKILAQRPGGMGKGSGGDGRWAPALARAAVATGCDGVFMETHPNPPEALSDSANSIPLAQIERLWRTLCAIDEIVDRR